MTVGFYTYKNVTANKLYNRKLISWQDYKYITQAKTSYCLSDRITECFDSKAENNANLAREIYDRGTVKPEEVSLIQSLKQFTENLAIRFAKILSKKDTNPEVLKIKKQIKKEFGIKSLYLDNNKVLAKKIQKSLKILKDNNLPLADEIIVNSMLGFCQGIPNPQKRVLILNPNVYDIYYFSTNSPLHFIIHDGIHVGQPAHEEINFSKMPEKFKTTIDNLSFYASDNYIIEIHAELMTKKLLTPEAFTTDEQEALDYIENLYKQCS